MTAVLGGLAPRGTLMIIGVTEPLTIDPVPLILGSKSVRGWYSGTSIDSQETLAFSALSGVRPMTEIFPLERFGVFSRNEALGLAGRNMARVLAAIPFVAPG